MINSVASAADLNSDCRSATINRAALEAALRAEGEDFFQAVATERPHLFSDTAFFISAAQMAQMQAIIAAVEQVAALPAWVAAAPLPAGIHSAPQAQGVFFGYDFHLNADGAHLIEINTNAGGAFLNTLLLRSQQKTAMPGEAAAQNNLDDIFLDMFRNEWRLERGDAPLRTIVIVDDLPQQQYLHPEFVLAQRTFERAGIAALIADPAELDARTDGLYCRGRKADLIYNRLTDFSLQQHPALHDAYRNQRVVLTPHPHAYAIFADKHNLARLTDPDALTAMGASSDAVAVLQAGIPQTRLVQAADAEKWWLERKLWFFKPVSGFGSRGTYRGSGMTQRVFNEVIQGGYVAQRLAIPGERAVCIEPEKPQTLKSDVRCYVYDGQVQLVVARLYQGQTTNFRTIGGGFSLVRIVG